jgi:DNA polymerase-3 subunit alpha
MDNIPMYIDRKHGREKVEYPHAMLEKILGVTYGIPVYQEQVMQMAQVMANYTLGGADILRRAMGKKKKSEMDKQRETFVTGAAENDVPKAKADDLMEKFAGYGFNKSHSAAYSVVAYQTAYLKANYPPEFMSAVMTSEMSDTKKLAIVLEEARHLGIQILPPSINRSQADFAVDQGRVRFGLAAIKGAGAAAIDCVIAERKKNGPFMSLFDLCKRVDLRVCNKKTLENLARAGAFDEFAGRREQFVAALDDAVRYAQKAQQDKLAGQNSLFGETAATTADVEPQLPFVDVWTRGDMLRNERELIGFYVSGHPLDEYKSVVRAFSTGNLGDPEALEVGRDYRFCGIVTAFRKHIMKNGKPMGFAQIEDLKGTGEVTVFSSQFDKFQSYLQPDELVMITGKLEKRGTTPSIIVNDVMPMWQVNEKFVKSITLRVNPLVVKTEDLESFKLLCAENRGGVKLYFDVNLPELGRNIRLRSRNFVVDATPEMMRTMGTLFGYDNVILGSDG